MGKRRASRRSPAAGVLIAGLAVAQACLLTAAALAGRDLSYGAVVPLMVVVVVVATHLAGPRVGTAFAFLSGLVAVVAAHVSPVAPLVWVVLSLATAWWDQRVRRLVAVRSAAHDELLRGLLPPPSAHRTPSLLVATRYVPGDPRLAVGGDFYGILTLSSVRTAILIGDVSGHGPAAAALGMQLRTAWKTLVLADAPPETILRIMNVSVPRALGDDDDAQAAFATVACAWTDTAAQTVTIAVAGHPPPLVVSPSGVRPAAVAPGPPLGVSPDLSDWPVSVERFESPEWGLVFYTDGVIEGRAGGAGERFGAERVAEHLRRHSQVFCDGRCLDAILLDAEDRNGGPLHDDAVLIAVAPRPAAIPRAPAPQLREVSP